MRVVHHRTAQLSCLQPLHQSQDSQGTLPLPVQLFGLNRRIGDGLEYNTTNRVSTIHTDASEW